MREKTKRRRSLTAPLFWNTPEGEAMLGVLMFRRHSRHCSSLARRTDTGHGFELAASKAEVEPRNVTEHDGTPMSPIMGPLEIEHRPLGRCTNVY